jgi:hypothetical protein
MQVAQGRGLHRTPDIKWKLPQRIGQVGDNHFSRLTAAIPVQDEAKRALRVVLADQEHGALEKRASQFTAVQQQLAFEIL